MTWVDLVVLGVVAVSGLLALARGFVREVLGLGAWAGAAGFAYWGMPLARPQFARWIASPEWVGAATAAALFLGSLLVLMVVSGWIAGLVQGSRLGGLDRTLGLVFGLARGALLVVFAYIAVGMVIPIEQWPDGRAARPHIAVGLCQARFGRWRVCRRRPGRTSIRRRWRTRPPRKSCSGRSHWAAPWVRSRASRRGIRRLADAPRRPLRR